MKIVINVAWLNLDFERIVEEIVRAVFHEIMHEVLGTEDEEPVVMCEKAVFGN